METKEIEKIAKQEMRKMGINPSWNGYKFWAAAVAECETFSCSIVYNRVAQKYRTTATRVERAMRYALKYATEDLSKIFEMNRKITNAQFFYLLKERIEVKVNYETAENVEK